MIGIPSSNSFEAAFAIVSANLLSYGLSSLREAARSLNLHPSSLRIVIESSGTLRFENISLDFQSTSILLSELEE